MDIELLNKTAKAFIYPMSGLNAVQLIKNIQDSHRYILLVFWDKLEDHTEGFRQSAEYQQWKALLLHFLLLTLQLRFSAV